jgi:hypothetical protein
MRKFKSLAIGGRRRSAARTSYRAVDFVRPGGEAILLVGVALGCAQLGWAAIFPDASGPAAASTTEEELPSAPPLLRSPFAPMAANAAPSHAQALAGVKVVGIRQSDIAENSGVFLAFPDGHQRPFLIGHQIVEGVVLARVEPGRAVFAFDGGEETIEVEGHAASASFALMLMGRTPGSAGGSSAVPSMAPAAAVAAAPVQDLPEGVAQAASAGDAQWLAVTLSQVEMRDGQPYAWRVAASPPRAISEAGVAAGDFILSVNGHPPGEPTALLAVAQAREIRLTVERPSGERRIVTVQGTPS